MGARVLDIALLRRYNGDFHNNGRIYLAQRKAAEEIGSQSTIARWFRELKHYGFIVMTQGHCLGVEGKGHAPHWRLTELGYMKDQPTRDFMRWKSGDFFADEKQNPVPENQDRVSRKTRTLVSRKTGTVNGTSVPENQDKGNGQRVPENQDKSSYTTCKAEDGSQGHAPPPLRWLARLQRRWRRQHCRRRQHDRDGGVDV